MEGAAQTFTSTAREEVTVKPKEPSNGETVRLTRQDRIMPAVCVPLVSFFDSHIDHKRLIESLARVLVRFPILAGSFCEVSASTEAGGNTKGVALNDTGIAFVVADADATLDDFGGFSFRKNATAFALPLIHYASDAVATVKVTYLKPTTSGRKGTVIGLTVHHTVVDAESIAFFLNSWAEETRGVSSLPQPCHDRNLLDSLEPNSGEMASPQPLFYQPPEVTMQGIMEYVKRLPGAQSEILQFSAEGLNLLKKEASPQDGWISTHDALAALLWQVTTIMRKSDESKNMRFGMACNIRKRLSPPLPTGYFGNAIQYVITELPVATVKHAPISEVAGAIRAAVNNFSDPTIRANLAWLREQEQNGVDSKGIRHNWTFDDFALTSWVSYPLYSADFGSGAPLWVGPCAGSAPGLILLLPCPPSSPGIRAIVHFCSPEAKDFDEYVLPTIAKYLQ